MPSTHYPQELWFDLETLINEAQPRSIALIGEVASEVDGGLLNNYVQQSAVLGIEVNIFKLNQQNAQGLKQAVDLVIIANTLETLSKSEATQLLCRFRDVWSRHLCLCINFDAADWSQNELFGLGLKRVALYENGKQQFGLFKYNLQSYKQTPDWLNADNWANPNMWEKYRW